MKLGVNLLNYWLEQRSRDQMILAARDDKMLQSLLDNQKTQAGDPFVQITRRVLFLTITFTLCYLMVYYAMNPSITYDVIVPKGDGARWGVLGWIFGGRDWELVQMTGGLLLTSFFDLCFMVIGFYAVPSKRR